MSRAATPTGPSLHARTTEGDGHERDQHHADEGRRPRARLRSLDDPGRGGAPAPHRAHGVLGPAHPRRHRALHRHRGPAGQGPDDPAGRRRQGEQRPHHPARRRQPAAERAARAARPPRTARRRRRQQLRRAAGRPDPEEPAVRGRLGGHQPQAAGRAHQGPVRRPGRRGHHRGRPGHPRHRRPHRDREAAPRRPRPLVGGQHPRAAAGRPPGRDPDLAAAGDRAHGLRHRTARRAVADLGRDPAVHRGRGHQHAPGAHGDRRRRRLRAGDDRAQARARVRRERAGEHPRGHAVRAGAAGVLHDPHAVPRDRDPRDVRPRRRAGAGRLVPLGHQGGRCRARPRLERYVGRRVPPVRPARPGRRVLRPYAARVAGARRDPRRARARGLRPDHRLDHPVDPGLRRHRSRRARGARRCRARRGCGRCRRGGGSRPRP